MRGKTIESKNDFCINHRLEPGQYCLTDVFAGVRACEILSAIFADAEEIDTAIASTKVFVVDIPHEIFVDNDNGSINIALKYLRDTSDETLYLDIIHELCHVKQHMQGRDLYDMSKAYVDRDTEIEAYQVTVQEARRIGLNDDDILDYLRVSWITSEEHKRLARRMDVN
ncbi:MAG: hypothetical protein JRD69_07375 [Deltaproteobacteria bacterium]|nr:hypothetical protein [Deltaproteobacteria bacterium]